MHIYSNGSRFRLKPKLCIFVLLLFLAQIPTLQTQKPISLSPHISEIKPNANQDSAVPKKKEKWNLD